jgi:hypothetical protein
MIAEEHQMSGFENATKFFHACESVKGWDECSKYVELDASFSAQCEPLVEIKTVVEYVNWMTNFCETIAPESSYKLHSSAYDDATRTATFFATFTLKHTGEGGPVPPTNRETNTEYVYIFTMTGDDKIQRIQKVWNAPWAMRELGWV